MRKATFALISTFSLFITACGLNKMTDTLDKSEAAIETNTQTIAKSSEVIQGNTEAICKSTEAIQKNNEILGILVGGSSIWLRALIATLIILFIAALLIVAFSYRSFVKKYAYTTRDAKVRVSRSRRSRF